MTSRLVLANEEIPIYPGNRLHRYPNKYVVSPPSIISIIDIYCFLAICQMYSIDHNCGIYITAPCGTMIGLINIWFDLIFLYPIGRRKISSGLNLEQCHFIPRDNGVFNICWIKFKKPMKSHESIVQWECI